MINCNIPDPIYGRTILLLVGKKSLVQKYLNDNFDPDYEMEGNFGEVNYFDIPDTRVGSKRVFYIWLDSYDESVQDVGTVAHECFHLVCYIFDDLGIKYCDESEEAWAWYLDYLVQQVLKVLEGR